MTATSGAASAPTDRTRPTVSTRDRDAVREGLARWLASRYEGTRLVIEALAAPDGTGMSSDTLLVDARAGDGITERLVVRLAPNADAAPLFPEYDLAGQYRTMAEVAARSPVPVPPLRAFEPDPSFLGSEFLVMDRVDGLVPPDVPPYTFGVGWVAEADEDQLARLEAGAVGILAALHGIPDAPAVFSWLARAGTGSSALRAHVDAQRAYADWVLGGRESRIIEQGFAWLETHWPTDEGPTVLSWGDARIGNIIFSDFEPVAVLDWEMASLGPRELDVAWLIYLHRFFDDLARQYGLPGLPNLLRRDVVAQRYESLTGYELGDLDWYTAYAAVRHAIIMTRVGLRAVHLGDAEMPADLDDFVLHRASLLAMLDGTYWEGVPR